MRKARLDRRQTEVPDLHLQVFVQENVVRLQVTMDYIFCTVFLGEKSGGQTTDSQIRKFVNSLQVIHSLCRLTADIDDLSLIKM